MKHEAEIQQQAIAETPCTEAAPCFACLRCGFKICNILRDSPTVRAHMTGIETLPEWKHAAEAEPTTYAAWIDPGRAASLTKPHVATLPTGERIELPAGTVLREGTGGDPDIIATAVDLLRRAFDENARLREEGWLQGDADPVYAEITAFLAEHEEPNLTERVGLPREPPRCTGKRPANAGTTGIECDDYACNVHGRGAIRRLHEMAPSEWPTPRAMAEIACRKRTIGQGFQSGFEEGVIAERARFEAAPLVSLADYAKPRT